VSDTLAVRSGIVALSAFSGSKWQTVATTGSEMTELSTEGAPGESRRTSPAGERWSQAFIKAAAILFLAWAGFLFVPDRLLAFLSTRVTPHSRDALVSAWVGAWFLGMCWIFVTLQPGRNT
jgi:hypothetical protein